MISPLKAFTQGFDLDWFGEDCGARLAGPVPLYEIGRMLNEQTDIVFPLCRVLKTEFKDIITVTPARLQHRTSRLILNPRIAAHRKFKKV